MEENDKWNTFKVEAELESHEIPIGSESEFITEHYWGYAHVNEQCSNEYEVTHPRWEGYTVLKTKVDVDFGSVYGEEFQILNNATPVSVMLAEGSEITVEGKVKLKSNKDPR